MNLLLSDVPVEAGVEIGYHPVPAWKRCPKEVPRCVDV
jgi:hypothetical protein